MYYGGGDFTVLIFMQKNQIEENNVVTSMSIDELHDNVDELETSTNDLKTQLSTMLDQLQAMDDVVKTNKETVESISMTATNSGENISRVEKNALALQKSLNEYISKFETETSNTNEEVKSSFDVVNKDIANMLNTINSNNNTQNNNYDSLSNQINDTMDDMDNFLKKIEKEDADQYQNITKQVNEFSTSLNTYLENFNAALNETLENNLTDLNTHLDTVQTDIDVTKTEITDLLNQVNEGQTQDLQKKFEAIQKHLNDITVHFDETLANIKKLIEDLSAQNKAEYEGTINKLLSVQSVLEALNKTNTKAITDTLTELEKNYNEKLQLFQQNVNEAFDNVGQQITDSNNSLSETINNKVDQSNNSLSEKLKTVITNQGNDTQELKDKIDYLQETVNQSFTSVSNGKKLLASTLLTYDVQVEEDASFQTFSEALALLGNQKVAGDTVIEIVNNSDNITPDKILAGKSITKSDVTVENGSYTTKETTINGTATSDATAAAGEILTGKTAYIKGNKVTGNMPNRGALNWNPNSSTSYSVPAGYYSGGTISTSNAYNAGYSKGQQDLKNSGATAVNPRNGEVGAANGYGYVHLPEGYYSPQGTTWAPEVRLSYDQVRYLANACGVGYDAGKAAASGSTGGLTIDGWQKADWNASTTSCYVTPGTYKVSAIYKAAGYYTPHFELYINGNLFYKWQSGPDEWEHLDLDIYIPYEGTLECVASSANNNSGMSHLYGAIYRK